MCLMLPVICFEIAEFCDIASFVVILLTGDYSWLTMKEQLWTISIQMFQISFICLTPRTMYSQRPLRSIFFSRKFSENMDKNQVAKEGHLFYR